MFKSMMSLHPVAFAALTNYNAADAYRAASR